MTTKIGRNFMLRTTSAGRCQYFHAIRKMAETGYMKTYTIIPRI